jgi:hypothetical protein
VVSWGLGTRIDSSSNLKTRELSELKRSLEFLRLESPNHSFSFSGRKSLSSVLPQSSTVARVSIYDQFSFVVLAMLGLGYLVIWLFGQLSIWSFGC